MKGNVLSQSETRVTEVISFILEQYRNEKVIHDIEVASELILVARILHQRLKIMQTFFNQLFLARGFTSASCHFFYFFPNFNDSFFHIIKCKVQSN